MPSLVGGIVGASSRLSGGLAAIGPCMVSDVPPANIFRRGPAIEPRVGRFRKIITGITKDAAGTPLGGCVVKAYRTSDDALRYVTLSDASGLYEVSLFAEDGPYYVVAYKAGAPDVMGTTSNQLVSV